MGGRFGEIRRGSQRGQPPPLAHNLWNKGVGVIPALRLAGKMRVSQGGHTRFIQQENVQVFVNGNKQKPCSVSVSGGG